MNLEAKNSYRGRCGADPASKQIREDMVSKKCAELGVKRGDLDAIAWFAFGDENFGVDKAFDEIRLHFALAALGFIGAERERCAKIAENYRVSHAEEMQEDVSVAEGIGRASLVRGIAAEIRKGPAQPR